MEIFKSDRYFTLYDASTSHGQIIFRSQKSTIEKFNLDIIFYDTSFIQISSTLKGIKIYKAETAKVETALNYNTVKKYLSYENHYVFEIESNEEKYFIAASFIKVFENDLDWADSTINYANRDRIKEIPLSQFYT